VVGVADFGRPETVLLVGLTWSQSRRRLAELGRRRMVALALLALVSLTNGLLLVALLGSLIGGHEHSGAQLLLKAVGDLGHERDRLRLWYWGFDRGGPVRRLEPDPPPPDFQFPQMENPQLAAPGWYPHIVDYIYISFTNAIAFSPTDAMPLSRRAKLLMLAESAVSALIGTRPSCAKSARWFAVASAHASCSGHSHRPARRGRRLGEELTHAPRRARR